MLLQLVVHEESKHLYDKEGSKDCFTLALPSHTLSVQICSPLRVNEQIAQNKHSDFNGRHELKSVTSWTMCMTCTWTCEVTLNHCLM